MLITIRFKSELSNPVESPPGIIFILFLLSSSILLSEKPSILFSINRLLIFSIFSLLPERIIISLFSFNHFFISFINNSVSLL